MNIFLKQATRRPLFTTLLVLLLSFSVLLSCIGYSAWESAKTQKSEISNGYTTIAIPIEPDLSNLSPEEIATALQNRVFADNAAQEAPQITMVDRRCLLSAHIAGSRSLSSSSIDPSEYNTAFDGECYSLAVFALRCSGIREQPTEGMFLYDATFSVEEIVCLSDAYNTFPRPDSVHIYSDVRESNGAAPFEKGKTYLVFGQYQDHRVVRSADGHDQVKNENRYIVPFPEINSNFYGEPSSLELGSYNGLDYHFPAAGQLPWVCEYTGSVTDYLNSDAASTWREDIVPLCQLNYESAAVILTDRAESMYSFNTGDEALLSGRFFTGEEYTNGDDVCVISAAYAEQNGLRLGDMIQLDYYDSGFGEYNNGATANSMLAAEDPGPYRQRYYMSLDDAIGVCKNYTVIGIYTGARFAFGAYQLNADTILVPKASVPNAQNYETRANSLLNTFVLKNGSAKEFEKYMEQQNLAGQFLYFDQDFSSMQESLDALETNAMRLMMVGIGVFLLTSALFLFLNFRRMNLTIRGVRLLGRSSKAVFREIIMALIPLETLAVLFGTCAAIALFDVVTRNLLSSALTLRPEAMAVSAVTAFVFLMVSTMISTAIFANRKLMKAK
ncbi:MAG: ABC transporter permease [Oscillospiraceae bacterium]